MGHRYTKTNICGIGNIGTNKQTWVQSLSEHIPVYCSMLDMIYSCWNQSRCFERSESYGANSEEGLEVLGYGSVGYYGYGIVEALFGYEWSFVLTRSEGFPTIIHG